ncbi:Hsp20 family protein [Aquibacillus halophilus]|uniref:Hsp20 family protein n=1 Tax=Aquibacillus halophilus TaxID=930132 RepID=A0A6A8DBV5_9BACI|nr:Hsp20/alpha crystallin family protein [Aquibacillus halophilus]MRH43205.1 Hsp20 family protein [Aquibacillus halophilus]
MYYDNNHKLDGMQKGSRGSYYNRQKEVRTPKVDLFETDNSYYLRISLPGVKKENLEVFINEHGLLEIKGKVVTYIPDNAQKIILQEIYQGPFHRKVKIPTKIDKQNVDFSYNNGILEVYLN